MKLPECDKLHRDNMMYALRKIKSNSGKEILLDLWAKIPYLPVPDISSHYSPSYSWGGMFRLTKDYLDFPVYERWVLNEWEQLTEEEFINQIKINWSI
jgi:hypothetical protein